MANAELSAAGLDRHAPLSASARELLVAELDDGALTARGAARVRAVALTLADLGGLDGPLCDDVVATALHLRAELAPLLGVRR